MRLRRVLQSAYPSVAGSEEYGSCGAAKRKEFREKNVMGGENNEGRGFLPAP
jgi:hypothetical protein